MAALSVAVTRRVSWVPDCDVSKFFDNVDKRVIRLIRKWLNAGVIVGDELHSSPRRLLHRVL